MRKIITAPPPLFFFLNSTPTHPRTHPHRDVHFLSAMTFEPMAANFCRGRHGPFRSLALDALTPHLLHASTVHGDLLTFDTTPQHPRRPGQQQQFARGGVEEGHCALVHKVASRTEGFASLTLAALPGGYLLAASPRGDLFAYNTTGLRDAAAPLSLVFHLAFSPPVSSGLREGGTDAPVFFSASLARTMAGGGTMARLPSNFVLHVASTTEELLLFEVLLPYRRPRPLDFGWIRLPLMVLAIGLVFAWHFNKQDTTRPRGGRARMDRNPMPAAAQLRNIGLRPQGRRMYDDVDDDPDDGFIGLAGINEDGEEDAEELNQRLRGLLRERGGRDYAF